MVELSQALPRPMSVGEMQPLSAQPLEEAIRAQGFATLAPGATIFVRGCFRNPAGGQAYQDLGTGVLGGAVDVVITGTSNENVTFKGAPSLYLQPVSSELLAIRGQIASVQARIPAGSDSEEAQNSLDKSKRSMSPEDEAELLRLNEAVRAAEAQVAQTALSNVALQGQPTDTGRLDLSQLVGVEFLGPADRMSLASDRNR